MSVFEKLKQNREAGLQKLLEAAAGDNSKDKYQDDRFWSPGVDKAGNGFAIIRFLPDPDEKQWITYYEHGFQGPTGKWYIEKSRTSLNNQPDPVSEMNTRLWNSGREEDKETARARKRKVNNVSNIYVISDPSNPENEGKVFLYRYGVKIKDKVMDVVNPKYQDETPLNPFCMWNGANFKIKIAQVAGYRNYDRSEFDAPAPLLGGDEEKLVGVCDSLHSLSEFTDPAQYKSYNELKARLNEVLGEDAADDAADDVPMDFAPRPKSASDPMEFASTASAESSSNNEEDEEALNYFAKLAGS
jgi:hypothetical protein